jgi:molecular chaperone DnaK
VPQIEVTFDIDANGILQVSAKDKATGKDQSITIDNSGGLSESEIQTMINDAEKHAEEDKQRREVIESKNKLGTMVAHVETLMQQLGEKLEGEQLLELEREKDAAKTALETGDKTKMEDAFVTLTQKVQELSELVASQVASEAESQDEDDVIDAEVVNG